MRLSILRIYRGTFLFIFSFFTVLTAGNFFDSAYAQLFAPRAAEVYYENGPRNVTPQKAVTPAYVQKSDVVFVAEKSEKKIPVRNIPDIWRIETAAASHLAPTPGEISKWVVRRWTETGWETSSLEEFYKTTTPEYPIYMYVHGNRAEPEDATRDGVHIMNLLPAGVTPRFVIWSWDTEKVASKLRVEYAAKAVWADMQGVYLAYFLKEIAPDVPVTLAGYSFGVRTVLCALHLCGGGTFSGKSLATQEKTDVKSHEVKTAVKIPEKTNFRAVLIAGATENSDLLPHGRFSQAPAVSQKIFVTVNPADPALRFYPKISEGRVKALGFTGIEKRFQNAGNEKITPIPVNMVSHKVRDYLAISTVRWALSP